MKWENPLRHRSAIVASTFLFMLLLCPTLCHAHALHPVYYSLGPYVLFIPLTSLVGLVPLVAVVAFHTLFLRLIFRRRTVLQTLWRAAAAFVASKLGESIPGCAVLSAAPQMMWSSDSFQATLGIPLVLFLIGGVVNAIMLWAFYRPDRPGPARIFLAAVLLSATSYLALLLSTLGLLHAGWIR